MPLIGHDNFVKLFKRLVKERRLSNSYIFFGETQVGKYTFAISLGSLIEHGVFENPESTKDSYKKLLTETLVIKPTEGSIGIDEIREVKLFLSIKPVQANIRTVIVDDSQLLTPQAQHAALKITEEPPHGSLLIFITNNTDSLMPTLQSRFQKIHFRRLSTKSIIGMLEGTYEIAKSNAKNIAEMSLGRPGRAVDLVSNENITEIYKNAVSILKNNSQKRQIIDNLIEKQEDIYPFFTELIAQLARDPIKNYDNLRNITERMTLMHQFNTNKRLQLETALWNI